MSIPQLIVNIPNDAKYFYRSKPFDEIKLEFHPCLLFNCCLWS